MDTNYDVISLFNRGFKKYTYIGTSLWSKVQAFLESSRDDNVWLGNSDQSFFEQEEVTRFKRVKDGNWKSFLISEYNDIEVA